MKCRLIAILFKISGFSRCTSYSARNQQGFYLTKWLWWAASFKCLMYLGCITLTCQRSEQRDLELTKVGNIWFLSPLVLSKWEDLAFSVCMLFEESVFIFQFLNDKMHNYVKQNIIINFIIQKLKNKHTLLKKYTNWES